VELDGSESADEDGTIESYSWSLAGAVIATGVNPVVTLPVGSQQIVLTVTDDDGLTDTDEVEIKINEPANQAPEADAGNAQEVTDNDNDGQERIELDGSKSKDKDGTIVSYSWTINGEEIATGEPPAVSLSTGEHTIRLTVTDDDGLTDSDEVAVTIHEAPEKAPVADAGEDQVLTDVDGLGELEVELDGSESADEDGTIESYSWSLAGAVIATGVNPVVTLPVGSQQIVLTVTDDDGLTDTDEVEIKINEPANQAPDADAGGNKEVTDTDLNGSEIVTLDGSGSSDPEGNIVAYSWSINGEEIATGVNATAELGIGTTTIVLTVTDEGGLTDTDEVIFRILEGEDEGGGETENISPVAVAGNDQTLTDTDMDGKEAVSLDGSASTDEDGTIVSYSWSVNGEEIATGMNATVELDTGTHNILLTVTDNGGLTATDEVIIIINEGEETGGEGNGDGEGVDERIAFLPNLFSPNGDQMNDYFMLHATGIDKIHWRIYNRQGRLVYETKDVAEATMVGWDGRANGEPQPEGSYVWILEGSYEDGSPVLVNGDVKGSVTLIR
ncbi:gliding motility-associated C-terminal domain-containing protein, partial [Nafulsella turpanensis]|uniref:gliding motility-associated C-terminal domain-containing protein n=1 Tax=Nafulsella turpanensis TaxID=1265690 RepID=UPI000476478C